MKELDGTTAAITKVKPHFRVSLDEETMVLSIAGAVTANEIFSPFIFRGWFVMVCLFVCLTCTIQLYTTRVVIGIPTRSTVCKLLATSSY